MTGVGLGWSIAGGVVVLDQLTKWWAVTALSDGPVILIDDFLRFALTRNPGTAFSLFQGSGVLVGFLGLGIIVVVAVMLDQVAQRSEVAALGLILGGAIGNVADRIFRGAGILDGAVVDWIDFDFFPTFNVADSALSIGVVLAILAGLWGARHEPQ